MVKMDWGTETRITCKAQVNVKKDLNQVVAVAVAVA